MAGDLTRHRVSELIARGVLALGDGYRAKNTELGDQGLPFARAGNIDGQFLFEDADKIDVAKIKVPADKISRPDDTVFTSKGTVGRFARVSSETPRFVYSPQLCYWRSLNKEHLDAGYLYYWLSGPEFYSQYKGVSGQTDMAEYVSLGDQRSMYIALPNILRQRAIAHLLGSLDDKIELNRRMAATLEEMARALFKSWFIDFDPVHAKAEGRDPGLPATTAALFPDTFGEDGLPMGWNSVALSDLATLDRTSVNPASLGEVVVDHYSLPAFDSNRAPIREPASSIKSSKLYLSAPIVLFSKLNPDRPRVWPLRQANKIAIASTEFLALRPSRLSSLTWLTCLLSSDAFVAKAAGMVTGTSKSHQRVQPDSLLRTAWSTPVDGVMVAFEQVVAPLHERVDSLLAETQQLAALRDTLLPKLISGELRIKDAGKNVEAA